VAAIFFEGHFMSLRRQLLIGISAIFFFVILGLGALGVSGTRNYLEEQLGSHAQEAATSLSHRLAQAIGSGDTVMAETLVATLFDRGYFQRIAVLGLDGKVLVERRLPAKIDDVPLWFSNLVPLKAPPGEAFLNSGWRQLGKIVVESQPTYAYQYLWSSALEIGGWMLFAYLLALALTRQTLRWILRPLSDIERTAVAIQHKHFEQIKSKPKALELARVVSAMNNMSRKISEFLDAESRKAEQFRREAYQDELTGLDNRRSFELRLGQCLEGELAYSDAALIGVEINNLKHFNTDASYREGDALLANVAAATRAELGEQATIMCRTGGGAFAFAVFEKDLMTLTELGRKLRDRLQTLFAALPETTEVSFSIGMIHIHHGDSRARVMSRLDLAIESARQSGRNALQYVVDLEASDAAVGSLEWREVIRNALAENRWTLLAQRVVSLSTGELMQQEIMTRLVDYDGNLVPASIFLPMAMRHKLMPEIDRALLSLVFQRLENRGDTTPLNLALNLSNQSLEHQDFSTWLASRLARFRHVGVTLAFEITEYGCSLNLERSRAFADMLRANKVRFGIDHFGLTPHSLQLLRELPPDYVKLDAGLVAEAPQSESSRAMLRAIVSLASSLEVEVIAQGIETEEQVNLLRDDAVKGGQGYHFGPPTEGAL
jgi:diguanylate cyclase (GGDEF)-like protein